MLPVFFPLIRIAVFFPAPAATADTIDLSLTLTVSFFTLFFVVFFILMVALSPTKIETLSYARAGFFAEASAGAEIIAPISKTPTMTTLIIFLIFFIICSHFLFLEHITRNNHNASGDYS